MRELSRPEEGIHGSGGPTVQRSLARTAWYGLLVALAYFVAGRLALLLAIPPGYATAIWPPSGIALAALLVRGNSLWPGVWLGSVLVNFSTSLASGAAAPLSALALSAGIAAGSTLQALLGAWLIRHYVGVPNPLVEERTVTRFLLLGGPLSCTVSPTLGVSCLLWTGTIGASEFSRHWWTWWVGDTIGAAFVAPIVMIWTAEPAHVWRRRKRSVALPLGVVFTLAVVLFLRASKLQEDSIQLTFQAQARAITQALRKALDGPLAELRTVGTLFSAALEVGHDDFHALGESASSSQHGLVALAWCPRVRDAAREAYEHSIEDDGDRAPVIREPDARGGLARAARREEYVPVRHLEVSGASGLALGLDLAVDPVLGQVLRAARESGEPVAVPLRRTSLGGPPTLLLLILPIFERGFPHDTTHERETHLRGYLGAIVALDQLAGAALAGLERTNVDVRLLQAGAETGEGALWVAEPSAGRSPTAGADPSPVQAALRLTTSLEYEPLPVDVEVSAAPAYVASAARSWNAWAVLAGGLFVGALLGAFLLTVSGRAVLIEEQVALRTAELSRANAALGREVAEREQARQVLLEKEQQLLQAQKMEAIGRLAGGIAHDFNNYLTGILGYAELVARQPQTREELQQSVGEITRAAERAAALTKQLLAFSRRENVQMQLADLNGAVRNVDGILRSLVGETVELELTLEARRATVRIGRGQLEQVVMNLVVNARDAVRPGGRIELRTANVEQDGGSFVALSVRDDGVGMDAATKQHLFEPYFTTKERGRGTGLGLATVYAITQQTGGRIEVESEPGAGSCFTVLFPREDGAGVETARLSSPGGGAETLLVVEDEEVVRRVTVAFLREQGYRVLEAADGAQALEVLRAHAGPLDGVITDVVMPGMSGPQTVAEIRRLRPGTRAVYMSGYAADHLREPEDTSLFLSKPFRSEALARAIRELLDRG